jgi:hypothetical protein
MSAVVLPFRRRFDPLEPAAEARYDRVVDELNDLSNQRRRNALKAQGLERQFVENDLSVLGGKRRGQPLSPEGRRRRLAQLLSLHDEQSRIEAEFLRMQTVFESMNADLDAWARDTYGMQG